jgi:hypothetical protein
MTAVYIVGNRSAWDDNELRYSLRSVEKFAPAIDKICIVGYKPDFLNDKIKHIPYEDIYFNAARNIAEKILRYCEVHRGERFLLMADDYYFLKPFDVVNHKYCYRGTLHDVITAHHGLFVHHCMATEHILKKSGLNAYNFDCHYPMVMDADKFIKVYNSYYWTDLPWGYTIKSLYANTLQVPFCDMREVEEVKLRRQKTIEGAKHFIKGKEMFSSGDSMVGDKMIEFMDGLYPNKSRYER